MSATQSKAVEAIAADWRSFKTIHQIDTCTLQDEAVAIAWNDSRKSLYHYQWLRDNCQCSQCVHPGTREQVFEIIDTPRGLKADIASINGDGLSIQWQDGHSSVFESGWLRTHAYDAATRQERLLAQRTVRTWGSELEIPTFNYDAVMNDDRALLAWLVASRDVGLTLMVNMPTLEETMEKVARRISFIRESNFGVVFEVRTKIEAVNSNAYTTLELPHHTDLPTRELQPGLQFLHCLVNNATGGDSTFVDGFSIANALRKDFPDDFRLLTEVPVSFWNKAPQSDYRSHSPIIGLNARGDVSEIRLANWLRAPFDVPEETMAAFYDAYRRLCSLARSPEYIVRRRLGAGEMWCFDNRRTMHARQAFDQSSGMRHLRGCYMDRDELLSRILVLQRSYGTAF